MRFLICVTFTALLLGCTGTLRQDISIETIEGTPLENIAVKHFTELADGILEEGYLWKVEYLDEARELIRVLNGDVIGDVYSSVLNAVKDSGSVIVFKNYPGGGGTGRHFELFILERQHQEIQIYSFEGTESGLCYEKVPRGYNGDNKRWDEKQWEQIWHLNHLEDIDGDGNMEIIIPEITCYHGAGGTIGNWPKIYKRINNTYVRADNEFPAFYKERILSLFEKAIIPAEALSKESADRDLKEHLNDDCYDIINRINDILRVKK